MAANYHPVSPHIWDDDDLEGLTFECRAFFIFLFTNQRQRPSGIYKATVAQLSVDSRLPPKTVAKYLVQLAERQRIVVDGAWIFIRGYFGRQPKSPNMLRSGEADVMLCTSRVILEAFGQRYPTLRQWSDNRLATVGEPLNNRCPIPELLPLPEPLPLPLPSDGRATVWPSPGALVSLYNEHAPDEAPSVETLSAARATKAREYLRQFPLEAWWLEVFAQMRRSRFLRGHGQATNGRKPFIADLDWLLTKGKDGTENAVKVHDGRYHDG